MRRRLRRLVQGLMHNPRDHLGAQGGLRPGRVASRRQSGDAFGKVALLPTPSPSRPTGRSSSCRTRQPTATRSGPPNQLLRRVPPRNQPFQRRPLRGRQPDACQCLRHESQNASPLGNLMLGSALAVAFRLCQWANSQGWRRAMRANHWVARRLCLFRPLYFRIAHLVRYRSRCRSGGYNADL